MEPNAATMRFHGGMDSNSGKIVIAPAYEFGNGVGAEADVLSWCFPDSPSAYLDKPACEYPPLRRDSQSAYPNLATFNWPTSGNFSAPLAAMDFTPGASLLSPEAWAGETDSDGYDQEVLSPLSNPDAPGSRTSQEFLDSPELTTLDTLKRSWSNDSATPQEHPNPKASKPKSRTIRKHSVQLRTASRKPRNPTATTATPNPRPTTTKTTKRSPSPTLSDDLTPEERRARRNHNLVEKQYRNRLNAQFERLLAVLPIETKVSSSSASSGAEYEGRLDNVVGGGSGADEKRMSKAEVLDLATRRIRALEADRERLVRERREMVRRMQVMMAGGLVAGGGRQGNGQGR